MAVADPVTAPAPPPRHERTVVVAACFGAWALFVVLAYLTPVLLDDWYQLAWHRTHEFGLPSIWTYAHYNYLHFNPRIGDTILLVLNGPRAIHLVLTPLVELAIPILVFALAFGRWPARVMRDLQLLLVIQVMLWLVVPIPGILYCYRPFTSNYVYAFAIVLMLFVVYRLDLARGVSAGGLWRVPVMLALGWLAGMSNEHTGPTQMAAMACLIYYAWRQRRLRAWMIAGAIGLFIGYPMLFFAPGQAQRYGGVAAQAGPLALIVQRGFDGNFEIILDFIGEAQLAIDLLVAALLAMALPRWRRGEGMPELPRAATLAIAALIVAAGAMVATQFASPVVGERLFFAPGALFVGALAQLAAYAFADRRARRILVGVCLALFAYGAFEMVTTYLGSYADNERRLALLHDAKPDSVAVVPQYHHWQRTRWYWGDDFQFASLREYVANEVFGLSGIEYDRHLRWAEPTPIEHFVATRTYEPPLPPEVALRAAPVRYIPTYWEWALVQFRKLRGLTSIEDVDGHRLVAYTVDVTASGLDDPRHRPVHVLTWTPGAQHFVIGRPWDNDLGHASVQVVRVTMPAGWTDAYVVGCGHSQRVEITEEGPDGPLVPVTLTCRGTYDAFVCDPDACWLAGRYWR